MALPKIDLPIFELKLVSISEPIKFRPFLVKEEKLLLMALQSSDDTEILKTIKQVMNNCLLDNSIDIDKLPIFDIEYLFLNVRARSVGEKVETYFICNKVVGTQKNEQDEEEDEKCMNMMTVQVNLLEIKPPINDLPSRIYLTKDIGIQLKYPTITTFKSLDELIETADSKPIFDMIYDSTEYVFDSQEVNYINETAREEFYIFMESLTQEQFDKITSFFEDLPTIFYDVDHACEKCGANHQLHMEGLSDFFI